MIRKWVLLGLAGLLTVGILGVFSGKQHKAYAATAVDVATKQHILSATVRITFYALPLDEHGQSQTIVVNGPQKVKFVTRDGLGTLVNLGGETVIVTHDHWTIQDRLQLARFYDASGVLLAEVYGDDFHRLIRYRDGGTMVLALPTQLVTTAVIGNAQMVQPEDVVFLTYLTPSSGRLDVVAMKVTNVHEHNGRDVFALLNLNGKVVDHGNSGGGVWYQGRLVGNMWGTIQTLRISQEQSGTFKSTERSIAALFPIGATQFRGLATRN